MISGCINLHFTTSNKRSILDVLLNQIKLYLIRTQILATGIFRFFLDLFFQKDFMNDKLRLNKSDSFLLRNQNKKFLLLTSLDNILNK